MFEDVFPEIQAALEPLSTHWFEELSAKASKDGHQCVAEVQQTSTKEGSAFRAPDTTTLDSQMFSTPKLFRRRGLQSPASVIGDFSAPGMQSSPPVLLWSDSSPCLFGSAKDSQQIEKNCGSRKTNACFVTGLDTPKSSLVLDTSAKRISESLGAQLNPDMSWNSSFNTPPSLTPTVILSKKEVQASPVSLLRDKEVIIVRTLFPSLTKDTQSASERKITDGNSETDVHAPNTSIDDLDGLWRQTIPDAIKDDDVRNTVESVLEGAEDVLSIFFSNSSSALRRVKTKERIKKRKNGVSKDVNTAILTMESSEHPASAPDVDPDSGSVNTCTAVESPPKSKDFTQWTPLSLSEVSDSKAKPIGTSELANKRTNLSSLSYESAQHTFTHSDAQIVQSSCGVEKLKCRPDSNPERSQARDSFREASPALTLSSKRRRFVYRLQSPSPSSEVKKPNATPASSSHAVIDSLTGTHSLETSLVHKSRHSEDHTHTADTGDHLLHPGETTGKQITPATLCIDHDLNMTQLCKVFAEDFTQDVNLEKSPNKSAQRNHDCLIKSSCVTRSMAVSEVPPKAPPGGESEDGVHHKDSDGNHKETDTTKIMSVTCASPKSDSNCSTNITSDCNRVTVSCGVSEYALHSPLKTANNIILEHPKAVTKAEATLDDVDQCMTHRVTSGISEPTKPSQKQVILSPDAAKLPSERYIHGINSGGETHFISSGISESGFKTASNKTITVSSSTLEKAKDIFKELDENTDKLQLQNVKLDKIPVPDLKNGQKSQRSSCIRVDGNSLTASQKADVTELCSILEEVSSQFDFTQVGNAKPGLKPLDDTPAKDWDSDILAEIDFDDSFNSDIERRVSQKYQSKTGASNHHEPELDSIHSKDGFIQNVNISQPCHNQQETRNRKWEMAKTLRVELGESNTSEEKKSISFGFKTARGNSLSVSDKYLSKARSLFADLEDGEENLGLKYDRTDAVEEKLQESPNCHTTEPSPEACNDGLYCPKQLNNRDLNTESVMKKTEVFKHAHGQEYLEAGQGAADQKVNLLQTKAGNVGFRTAGGKEVKVSEKALVMVRKLFNEVENFEADTTCEGHVLLKASQKTKAHSPVHQPDMFEDALSDSNVCTESLTKVGKEKSRNGAEKTCEMSICQSTIQSDGFKLASGRGVSVSASAIQKSKAIFKDIENGVNCSYGIKLKYADAKLDSGENGNRKRSVEGCKSASNEGLSISEKTFMEAETFFNQCDTDCTDISQGRGDESSVMDDCGFKAVAGSTVHLPETDNPNKEALSLKQQSTSLNKYVRKEFVKTSAETLQSTSGCSFSTASGKTVSVSTEALQRAKAVLGDSADASLCEKRMEISEEKNVPETHPTVPGRSWHFSTASGKKVPVSDKALQKAKSLFSECEVECLPLDGGLVNVASASAAAPERTTCFGFSAASGKGVAVSEKALKEAKAVFDGCGDVSVDVPEMESHLNPVKGAQKSSHGTQSLRECRPASARRPKGTFDITERGNTPADAFKSGNVGFSTASGRGVSVSKSALQVALRMFKDCDADPDASVHGQSSTTSERPSPGVDERCPPACDKMGRIETPISSLPSQQTNQDSSLLNRRPLNLNGCDVTQQEYFEQEALACSKALMEDELSKHGLLEDAGYRPSPTLQDKSSFEPNVARKRMPSGDLTGQPPLKRRLVSELNQISNGSRVCIPVRGSPNGSLNNRRVFKYNLHLKPNITHPSRDVTHCESGNPSLHVAFPRSSEQKGRASDLKAAVFVPPFKKDIRPEASRPCVSRNTAKAPSVFVPPLKREDGLSLGSSSQNSSMSKCPSPLSSGDENKMTSVKEKAHMVGKEEVCKKEMEAQRDEKLKIQTTVACEEKVSEVWQQSLALARDMQDMRIRKKKRQAIRPLPGSLYLAKTSGVNRMALREAVRYRCPVQHAQEELYRRGVHCKVSQISNDNAESFRFSCAEFFRLEAGGVQLADGGWLIPDNGASAGKEEFYRALCDTPGVDPKLISETWVYNHYRWIVWKRASMERTFPQVWAGLCLTPEQVLLQLKLRYDTEVDHSRRSALKKIIERDDTPAKTLVLCVCGTARADRDQVGADKAGAPAHPRAETASSAVWLTDGWYSIKGLLDLPLSIMLRKGRLRVGGKIMIHGAELIGSQDACPPLEAPDSLMLKISANSTRPARWDTKLGYYKDPRPFQVPLSSLYSTGGVVGCVDIIVLRSYPTQWMEKKSGGVFVFRNERAEEREARHHSSAKQKNVELLFSKIQAQLEKEEEEKKKTRSRRTFSRLEIERLQDGEKLYEAVESDPGYVETHLSVEQMEAVSSYRRVVAERRQAELQERLRRAVQEGREAEGGCPNRDVTPVWKLAIADASDQHSNHVYTLNIWRPSAELRSLLREGGRYRAYHLATSGTRKRCATSLVQFTATKKTHFKDIQVFPEWISERFPARRVASFWTLQNASYSSPCAEVDVVGYVISILDRQGTSPLLYLVDEKFDFISVRISSSLVQLAVEELLRPLVLLGVSNLQLQRLCAPVPSLHAGEQAVFTTHPKDAHLQEAMARLRTSVQGYESFFTVAEEKLSNLIPADCFQSPRTPGSLPKQNVRIATPQQAGRIFSPFTPVCKRGPVPPGSSEPKDPRSVKRKRGIDYLTRMPSPPPISPLAAVASPSVTRTFNPPRRSETPRSSGTGPVPSCRSTGPPDTEERWVNDEELAMINTQALLDGTGQPHGKVPPT